MTNAPAKQAMHNASKLNAAAYDAVVLSSVTSNLIDSKKKNEYGLHTKKEVATHLTGVWTTLSKHTIVSFSACAKRVATLHHNQSINQSTTLCNH